MRRHIDKPIFADIPIFWDALLGAQKVIMHLMLNAEKISCPIDSQALTHFTRNEAARSNGKMTVSANA